MAVNIFVHRRDWRNPGDLFSTPAAWLGDRLLGSAMDYKELANVRGVVADRLIIGGGGFGEKFIDCVEYFLCNNQVRDTVIWGTAWQSNRTDLDRFRQRCRLIGVREWLDAPTSDLQWVPCSSVLHSRLPRIAKHRPTANWLVVDHWKRRPIKFDLSHTRITNYNISMDQVLAAISDHHFVLTSSYHVVYWSILLRRRVVFISNPWLPKVDHMRWPVPSAVEFSWQLLDSTAIYPDAYEQALQANLDFLHQVQVLPDLPAQDHVVPDLVQYPGTP